MKLQASLRGAVALATVSLLASQQGFAQSATPRVIDCLLEPNVVIALGSPVDGILAEVAVERGDRVEAGQLVARLDSEVEEANVELARARVDRTPIESRQAQLDYRLDELRRTRQLHAKGNAPTMRLNEVENNAKLAEFELREAKVAYEIARLELERAESLLAQRRVTSPVNGVVLSRELAPGEHVHEQSTIAEIAALDPLYVEVYAPKDWLGRIAPGMSATIKPEAPVGGTYRADVVLVDPAVDAASGTFGLRLELPNPDYALPSGIKCEIAFEGS